ncbi:Uncharacterised protein [Mycobacterium tuberculosis]|uniref:Uncharacterized protein n=1 Tax=Mycobacterium tuberculosis TaxID=1773 RepID=A0A654U331_MYCTX|nr:Uncharacterised protein [Mycobacterium tuberculosis]CKT28361.1 Uncharacterised protein [Mycobacterium tuberculosis]CKU72499.1 Uncharacterised protein [Mycobacterium tuberculosis]CKV48182.1 Uncharacterised protein [Mycobacterium tuberculosis]CNJ89473.1 Uncharacterised protein [Mycobacterium tuberculosis]
MHLGETGSPKGLDGHRPANPVQRRQGHPDRTGAPSDPGRTLDITVDQIGGAVFTGVDGLPGDLIGRGRGGHRGFDLPVGRGEELKAAVDIDLVAVVGRRVV